MHNNNISHPTEGNHIMSRNLNPTKFNRNKSIRRTKSQNQFGQIDAKKSIMGNNAK